MADRRGIRVVRWPVSSSAMRSVGYDPARRLLDVEFPSGDVYRYFAVGAGVYQDFMAADSKGRFFTEHIQHTFEFERLT